MLVLLAAAAPILILFLFGHQIISALYEGVVFPELLSGRHTHSLQYYLDQLDALLISYSIRLTLIAAAVLFVFGPRWRPRLLLLALNIGIIWVSFELVALYGVRNPSFARSTGLHYPLYILHSDFAWQIAQFDPACAQFDEELGYRLKPPGCTLSSNEFTSKIAVNSSGLPDDEQSLERPEIILLGDSFAMGWGVSPSEGFGYLLEERTGLRVLNAGVSSYGTARQLRLLQQLDTSNMRYLVIQYFVNDKAENLALYEDGELQTMSRSEYQRQVTNYLDNRGYWFGRYTLGALKLIEREVVRALRGAQGTAEPASGPDPSLLLLHALEHASLKGEQALPIIIVDVSPDRSIVDKLSTMVENDPGWEHITVVDVQSELEPSHYYDYDAHLTPEGHRIVANAIADQILKAEEPRSTT